MEKTTPKVVRVIPVTKGAFTETLTYFTTKPVVPGSIVAISLRSKTIPGIAVEVTSLEEGKADLKNLGFKMKKIDRIITDRFFTASFIAAADRTAAFHASSVGLVLASLLPTALLADLARHGGEVPKRENLLKDQTVIQANFEERFGYYKSLIREEFAKKHSVFMVFPTTAHLDYAALHLEKGIEKYTVVLTTALGKRQLLTAWKRAATDKHPLLILATPGFLMLPREDIGAYVLDEEHSSHYKTPTRPYLDVRRFVLELAKAAGTRAVFGGTALTVETLFAREQGLFNSPLPVKARYVNEQQQYLIDRRKPGSGEQGKHLTVIAAQTQMLIRDALDRRKNVLLFGHRRGIASMTICNDCGAYLGCARCQSPLVLHDSPDGNFFLCHRCWKERPAETTCDNCKSWRLVPLGVGIERVREEALKLFPSTRVFSFDRDSLSTHKEAVERAAEFFKTQGSIIVGTEMVLPYLRSGIDTAIAVSIDSYFAIPDFRINEKVFQILLTLRDIGKTAFVIQTRKPERTLFERIVRGNLADFYRDELHDRERYDYPPYKLLIKVTREGKEADVIRDMEFLERELSGWRPALYPSFAAAPGTQKIHALIRVEPALWPHKELSQLLRSLPPQFVVSIDPEDIL